MSTLPVSPKKWFEFTHAYWVDVDTNTPLKCRVTAVRRGLVYWKRVADGSVCGSSTLCCIEEFARYVKPATAAA